MSIPTITSVTMFACPSCGSKAWHSYWSAILWARCDVCGTLWKHTRRADEPAEMITRQDIEMNASLNSSML
jgi:uncharacterized protein (DUF983 family)